MGHERLAWVGSLATTGRPCVTHPRPWKGGGKTLWSLLGRRVAWGLMGVCLRSGRRFGFGGGSGVCRLGGRRGRSRCCIGRWWEERRWIGERRFLHALNFCTLLPGPEAQQLATYLGWLMHGVKGGVAAGVLFVVPGALVMLALSVVYAVLGDVPWVGAVFFGLKSAVLLLVVEALLRIGRRALKGGVAWGVAGAAFLALYLFAVPFPLVVLGAGLVGLALPGAFAGGGRGTEAVEVPALLDAVLAADPGRAGRMARGARLGALVAGVAWVLPVLVLLPMGGAFADVAWFFSKMAVVTFGGAYAVLAYVAQDAVQSYHWLSAPEMLTGLGLAETTPGPLILVLQFVGFLAGYRAPGGVSGVLGGVVASVLTLWVTFAPCFVFVFLGAPLIERVQGNRVLAGALAAVTAGGGGGDREPDGVVRGAQPVPGDGAGAVGGAGVRCAGLGELGFVGGGVGGVGWGGVAGVEARGGLDAWGLCFGECGVASSLWDWGLVAVRLPTVSWEWVRCGLRAGSKREHEEHEKKKSHEKHEKTH